MTVSLERVQQWVKARRGYQFTVAFPEDDFSEASLSGETSRTLEQIVRLLRYMEVQGLPRGRDTR